MAFTFSDFKEIWEFSISVVGVGGVIAAYIKRAEVLEAIYKVTRGRRMLMKRAVAVDGVRQAGPGTGRVINQTAQQLTNVGCEDEAGRLRGLQEEAGNTSPKYMV